MTIFVAPYNLAMDFGINIVLLRSICRRATSRHGFGSFSSVTLFYLLQDTVDIGVTKHLFEELENTDNWDVFIGHYLGVDHAGQSF